MWYFLTKNDTKNKRNSPKKIVRAFNAFLNSKIQPIPSGLVLPRRSVSCRKSHHKPNKDTRALHRCPNPCKISTDVFRSMSPQGCTNCHVARTKSIVLPARHLRGLEWNCIAARWLALVSCVGLRFCPIVITLSPSASETDASCKWYAPAG